MSLQMARRNDEPVALLTPEERDVNGLGIGPNDGHSSRKIDHEYSIRGSIKFAWLGAYFSFSLLLTLYNKFVLGFFAFPWLLTCLHACFASMGTCFLLQMGYFKLTRLRRREIIALVAFSTLFTSNIALSNVSLAMVSVPFYQTMRMLCPIFTVIIYRAWYGRTYNMMTYVSLVPLVVGAAMTTAGEMVFTDAGFLLTIFGVTLAAVKTVVTNRFMTGTLALPPLEFILRMSPLAALQALACAAATGEVGRLRDLVTSADISLPSAIASLAGNGCLAFLLNISSFSTNKLAGALTMTVCGNLKQCLTVLLGIFLFNVTVDLLSGAGMAVTMFGAAIFSKAELDTKQRAYKPLDQSSA